MNCIANFAALIINNPEYVKFSPLGGRIIIMLIFSKFRPLRSKATRCSMATAYNHPRRLCYNIVYWHYCLLLVNRYFQSACLEPVDFTRDVPRECILSRTFRNLRYFERLCFGSVRNEHCR